MCATVIVDTWFKLPNVYKTESITMYLSLSRTEPVKNIKGNQLILNLSVTQQSEIISYTTKNVYLTI